MTPLCFAPSAALAPFIRRFEIIETDKPMTRTLLPEPGFILGFRYAGSSQLLQRSEAQRVPDNAITGLRDTTRVMHTSAKSGVLLLKFHPIGAAPFFPLPMENLFGQTTAAEDIFSPAQIAALSDKVCAATTHAERISLVEGFLCSQQKAPLDRLVGRAIQHLESSAGSLRIKALAESLHVSQDALEKRFRRVIGVTPKKLSSLLRLRRVLRLQSSGLGLTEAGFAAGYYDQPHFIREFRAMTGLAPTQFFQREEHC
jgi:AraC-like DNA-binding protein